MQPIELGAFMLAVERKSYYISSTCVAPVGSYLCLLLAPVTSIAFQTSGAHCAHWAQCTLGGVGRQLMQIGSHVRRKIGTRVKRISGLTWDQCWIPLKSLSATPSPSTIEWCKWLQEFPGFVEYDTQIGFKSNVYLMLPVKTHTCFCWHTKKIGMQNRRYLWFWWHTN